MTALRRPSSSTQQLHRRASQRYLSLRIVTYRSAATQQLHRRSSLNLSDDGAPVGAIRIKSSRWDHLLQLEDLKMCSCKSKRELDGAPVGATPLRCLLPELNPRP